MKQAIRGQTMRKKNERGTSIIEFAVVSTVLIPLLFGIVSLGVNLGHTTQVIQISRDAGHLYSKGVDFSQSSNKQIIVNLATPMGMTSATAGSGVVILSTIQQVYPADCTAAGISGGSCTNSGKDVITNRIVIGNSSYTSQYGTPSSSLIDSLGDLSTGSSSTHGYLNDSSAVATGFSNLI